MKKIKLKKFFFKTCLLVIVVFLSCTSYFKRPYEKDEVSKAYKNNLVFSEVSFISTGSSSKLNYIDYIYLGADSDKVHFLMKVYFTERSAGKPQVQKDISKTLSTENPNIILGGKKLSIYEATNDILIFQIL